MFSALTVRIPIATRTGLRILSVGAEWTVRGTWASSWGEQFNAMENTLKLYAEIHQRRVGLTMLHKRPFSDTNPARPNLFCSTDLPPLGLLSVASLNFNDPETTRSSPGSAAASPNGWGDRPPWCAPCSSCPSSCPGPRPCSTSAHGSSCPNKPDVTTAPLNSRRTQ